MNKRNFLALLVAAISGVALPQKTRKKFYITGLAHTATANDCTIPPIIAYGTDRVDALEHCCEGGGLTIWTEEEFKDFRRRLGRTFDEGCKEMLGAEKIKP